MVVRSADGHFSIEKLLLNAPLFDIAPFWAESDLVVPGFADPLGTGIDPLFRVFSGKVHYMDVLGDFASVYKTDVADIELPPGALRGVDITEDLLTDIFSGRDRAYDSAVLDFQGANLTERKGQLVTSETSPVSLAGFGTVSEYVKPVSLHWSHCPGVKKRVYVLDEVPRAIRGRFQPNPISCFDI